MDYYNEKDENKDISYFLAGGNDKNKKKPIIQLYKIIFDSINSNIEPIHDIDIEIEKVNLKGDIIYMNLSDDNDVIAIII